ncbi:MAG: class I SAM-dependent methyltransferase [bacterium]
MNEQLYRTFYEIETKHWWFVARQQIIKALLSRKLRLSKSSPVLDVGCGTGALLEMFSEQYTAYGTDTSPLAIEFCRKRGLANAILGTLDDLPNPELRYDLIAALDVIEHLEDDRGLLLQINTLLKPDGALILTVPAYQWMWSSHDDLNHHKRRYTKPQLQHLLASTGYSIDFISYYNTLLFPAAVATRLFERASKQHSDAALSMPGAFLNSTLTSIFSFERHLLRYSSLPFGLSIIALAHPAGR